MDELVALLDAKAKRWRAEQAAANQRAGLITAAIYNVHRKKGKRPLQAKDFFKAPPKIVSPEEMEAALDSWLERHNAGLGR